MSATGISPSIRRRRKWLAALLLAFASDGWTRGEQQGAPPPAGIIGQVRAPDGAPVASGDVLLQASGARVTARLASDGTFLVVPERAGLHQLSIVTPEFAPFRVNLTVPPSRRVELPPFQLADATFFEVRLVAPTGDVVGSPRVNRRSWDGDGMLLFSPQDETVRERVDPDGRLTLGPLPLGVTTMAVNVVPFALTRLSDLEVNGEGGVLEGGTVALSPGTTLHVDIVDGAGALLPFHDVTIEDARPRSPIAIPATKTDAHGRATFSRLGAGPYVLRTRASIRCHGAQLFAARRVSVSGRGAARVRLVAGGRAEVALASPAGPLIGAAVSLAPEAYVPADGQGTRPPDRLSSGLLPRGPFARAASCAAVADGDGRATFDGVPPGPARLAIRLPNSTYVRPVSFSAAADRVAVRIPDGVISLRVIDADTKRPIPRTQVTWASAGARVEAETTAAGDVLLEAVAGGPGTLGVEAPGYQQGQASFTAPPPDGQVVALTPLPPATLDVRVTTEAGDPIPDAAVYLVSDDPARAGYISVTEVTGRITFRDVPAGGLRLLTVAAGFVTRTTRVPGTLRGRVVITLGRLRSILPPAADATPVASRATAVADRDAPFRR